MTEREQRELLAQKGIINPDLTRSYVGQLLRWLGDLSLAEWLEEDR